MKNDFLKNIIKVNPTGNLFYRIIATNIHIIYSPGQVILLLRYKTTIASQT